MPGLANHLSGLFLRENKALVNNAVTLTGAWTGECVTQSLAAAANPADPAGRIADHQGMGWHISGDHRARADHGVKPDCMAAHDRSIGPNAGATPHESGGKFIAPAYIRARQQHVCEHHAGSAEYVVFDGHAFEERDIVLNLAAISDANLGADHHVLRNDTPGTYATTGQNVCEVPDLRALADLDIAIDHSSRVGEKISGAHGRYRCVQEETFGARSHYRGRRRGHFAHAPTF